MEDDRLREWADRLWEEGVTDHEMTKACAEAMGLKEVTRNDPRTPRVEQPAILVYGGGGFEIYSPLNHDAQAMALVKELGLNIEHYYWDDPLVSKHDAHGKLLGEAKHIDLNRAIVECVAKMQAATAPPQ